MTIASVILASIALIFVATQETSATTLYKGAFFDIQYPDDFEPQPSLDSFSADGHDSAFFHAPDKSISFYVYAPQWGGVATDIALNPAAETETVRTAQTTDISQTIRWTISANDESYQRSYVSTANIDGTGLVVFGVQYQDINLLKTYSKQYKLFRSSISLFAD